MQSAVLKVLLIVWLDDQIDIRPVEAQASGVGTVNIYMIVRELLLHNALNFTDQNLLDLLHFIHYGVCILLEQQDFVVEHVLDPVEVVARGHLRLVRDKLQTTWCLDVRLPVGAGSRRRWLLQRGFVSSHHL